MALAANQSLWAQDFRLVTFGRELTVQAKARASALNAEHPGSGRAMHRGCDVLS
jgi:hypothetical protein